MKFYEEEKVILCSHQLVAKGKNSNREHVVRIRFLPGIPLVTHAEALQLDQGLELLE